MTKHEYYLFGLFGLVWNYLNHGMGPIVLLLATNLTAIWAHRYGYWRGDKLWVA